MIGCDEYLNREQMLRMEISVNSYLVLRDYILNHSDAEVCYKFIRDYLNEMPARELLYIITFEKMLLDTREFETLLEMVFMH